MQFLETKIPPPVVMLLFAAAMWFTAQQVPPLVMNPTLKYILICVFVVSGFAGPIFGGMSFRMAKTTINPLQPDSASSLVTSGIYQVTRNPMYLGLLLLLCGWATYLASLWVLPFVLLFVAYIHYFQIIPEERALGKIFGDEFVDYKSRVRPWL